MPLSSAPRLITAPLNPTGAPAPSGCCGFSSDGPPLSLQIAGPPFEIATALRIGFAYE